MFSPRVRLASASLWRRTAWRGHNNDETAAAQKSINDRRRRRVEHASTADVFSLSLSLSLSLSIVVFGPTVVSGEADDYRLTFSGRHQRGFVVARRDVTPATAAAAAAAAAAQGQGRKQLISNVVVVVVASAPPIVDSVAVDAIWRLFSSTNPRTRLQLR